MRHFRFHAVWLESDRNGWCLDIAGVTYRGTIRVTLLTIQKHSEYGTGIVVGAVETRHMLDGFIVLGVLNQNAGGMTSVRIGAMYMFIIGSLVVHMATSAVRLIRNLKDRRKANAKRLNRTDARTV